MIIGFCGARSQRLQKLSANQTEERSRSLHNPHRQNLERRSRLKVILAFGSGTM
ncbi:hypothetical protein [Phormidesmis sp. 146-33]